MIIVALLFANLTWAQVLTKTPEGDFVLVGGSFRSGQLLRDYGRLEGLNLVIAPDFREDTFVVGGPRKLSKAVFRNYLSYVLNQSGYTMIQTPKTNIYNVAHARDVRYAAAAPYTDIAMVPKDHYYHQFHFKLRHVPAAELARNMRPMMSRYGRVIDVASSNALVIADTGQRIHRLHEIAQRLDTEAFVKSTEEVAALNQRYKKTVTKGRSWQEIFTSQTTLFGVLFLLVGIILGFGIRGYSMKKIEGGW